MLVQSWSAGLFLFAFQKAAAVPDGGHCDTRTIPGRWKRGPGCRLRFRGAVLRQTVEHARARWDEQESKEVCFDELNFH